jgi:hypothetical protein
MNEPAMKKLFLSLLFSVSILGTVFAAPPVISHEPPSSVTAGQALKVIARVSGNEALKSVNLYVSQSGNTAPVLLPMQSAGAGVFYGTIPAKLFAGTDFFRYYIDAQSVSGELAETRWVTLRVIGAGLGSESGGKPSSWKKPALIVAGGAAAIAVGVALSSDGGGGGGTDDGDGGGGDIADQVIVRTASENVSSASPALPSVTVLDAAGELAGRRIDRVRIRLEFDGVDAYADTYEASYNGATVFSGSAAGPKVEQVDVVGAADTTVTIRVLSSLPGEGGVSAYRWNATVTYFVVP